MQAKPKSRMIKRTVVLDPAVDAYVRKVWAMLIDSGADANYSTSLNMLALAVILEAQKSPGPLPRDSRRVLWDFVEKPESTQSIRINDTRDAILKFWGKQG
ncbi:MAG: hypothetical protein EXR48_03260 [Dehalococcoidia bacterium]|nr:hypothetical protein [Dehalococcoidia bacterium]